MTNLDEILDKLESKKTDSVAFQKKYKTRKMIELEKYYEGAEWAFTFAIALIKDANKSEVPTV